MKYVWPFEEVFSDGGQSVSALEVETANCLDGRLARAYVPYQKFENIYEPYEALKRGTAFKDLDLPCGKW